MVVGYGGEHQAAYSLLGAALGEGREVGRVGLGPTASEAWVHLPSALGGGCHSRHSLRGVMGVGACDLLLPCRTSLSGLPPSVPRRRGLPLLLPPSVPRR